jgi:restriction system protein
MPRRRNQQVGCAHGCGQLIATCIVLVVAVAIIGGMTQQLGTVGTVLVILAIAGAVIGIPIYMNSQQEHRERALTIADIDNMTGIDFERYVAKLLQSRGFQTELTATSGDLGVDIIAQGNGVRYAVQVKRQVNGVSRTAVSDAVGAMQHYRCQAAMVVTNSYFTSGAVQLAASSGCQLVNRDVLAQWVVDYQERG